MEQKKNTALRHFLSRSAVLMVCVIAFSFIFMPFQCSAATVNPDSRIDLMDSYEWNFKLYTHYGALWWEETHTSPKFDVDMVHNANSAEILWKPLVEESFTMVILGIQSQAITEIYFNDVKGKYVDSNGVSQITYYKFDGLVDKPNADGLFHIKVKFAESISHSIYITDCFALVPDSSGFTTCDGTYGLAHSRNPQNEIVGTDGFTYDEQVSFGSDKCKLSAHGKAFLLDGLLYMKFNMNRFIAVDKLVFVVYSSMPVTATSCIIDNSTGDIQYIPVTEVGQSGKSPKTITNGTSSFELYMQLVTVNIDGCSLYGNGYRLEVSLQADAAKAGDNSTSARLVYISVADASRIFVHPNNREIAGFVQWLLPHFVRIESDIKNGNALLIELNTYLEETLGMDVADINESLKAIDIDVSDILETALDIKSISEDMSANIQEIIDILNSGDSETGVSSIQGATDRLDEIGMQIGAVNRPNFSKDQFNLVENLPSTNYLAVLLSPVFEDGRIMLIITFAFICGICAYVLFGKR